ncbi:MAG: sorbitol dehydrogenase [Spirochaetales bacterium]|nr:MAG: sorbitol dehydrogenase [Spirochaetales bacterium]
MKALVKTSKGVGNIRLLEEPVPATGDNQVKVKVEYAGICGTDLHIMLDEYDYAVPVILGHEASGTVVEIGKNVKNIKVGDKVVTETNAVVCGECSLCRAGRFCLCPERKALGQKYNGVFAEYFVIGQENVYEIPKNVDMLSAAVSEPLACVVHAVCERSKILAGDVVIVSGPGPIGLLSLQVAKAEGAKVVVLGTSSDEKRFLKAKELGADYVVDVEKDDPADIIREETGGEGADVLIECSGAGPAVRKGIDLLKKRGIFTQIGLFSKDVTLDFNKICFKEINLFGCLSKTDFSWRKTLQLLKENKIDARSVISDILPLEEWEKGFRIAQEKGGLKVILKP